MTCTTTTTITSGTCEECTTTTFTGNCTCEANTTSFSLLHQDIIRTHILPRLDGCTLAAMGCVTPELHSLSSNKNLWSHICHSSWPSTTTPRMRHLISTFPDGPRSFFSLSYPPFPATLSPNHHLTLLPQLIISAVDLTYRGQCIFSEVHETETVTGWFRCSPFRVDMLGPKETVATPIRRPSHEDTCRDLVGELELSWIVLDPATTRAVNVSSFQPVSVERHWLSGEVHVRYAAVAGHVTCEILVTCVGVGHVLHVTEVSLKMVDMNGTHLNGRDSLVILHQGLEGKRGNECRGGMERGKEGRRRYLEYLERKRERRESELRREGRLDMMCVGFGISILVALFYLFCCSR